MSKQMFEIGRKIGHLTLIKRYKKGKRVFWTCLCDCGNYKDIREDSINSGKSISCGCGQKTTQFQKKIKRDSDHPEYFVAQGIFARCFDSNNVNYYKYGARGITLNLKEFPNILTLADYIFELRIQAGDVDSRKLSVERIDNNGNYEKSNIKLADKKVQNNNTRRNLYVEYQGKIYPLSVICKMLGIDRAKVYNRRTNNNITIQQAFNYYL